MRLSRSVLLWVVVIAVLVLVEVAQVAHLFNLGYTALLGNLLSFILALVLVTVLALVGAVFVGIFIATRALSQRGFSPFEEEMLKMRAEVREVRDRLEELARDRPRGPPGGAGP
jgi:uncharacterized membrane protein (DUF106 family)